MSRIRLLSETVASQVAAGEVVVEGDAVVERDGMQFFIDGESVPYLRGATLDFSGGLTGTGFQVVNPNASRTCGCGSSFETTQSD